MYYWIVNISRMASEDIYVGTDYVQAWKLFKAEWQKLTSDQKKDLECFLLLETQLENFNSDSDVEWRYICDLSYVNTLLTAATWLNTWWRFTGTDNEYPELEMNTIIECNGWTPNTDSDFEICTFSGERLVITDNCKAEVLKL